MKFTFAQIEAFAAVAEAGTFHAAARRLNLTQPAVSQRIHELEEAIQLPLFIRGGGRIRLTNEGVALVDYPGAFFRQRTSCRVIFEVAIRCTECFA